MNFVFLGPPGAGKGTLAAKAAAERGIPHISTGDIFRAAIKAQTPLGKQVKAIIDSGGLAGDDITIELVRERLALADARAGFILDGFPRTLAQAEALEGIARVGAAINFDIADEEVIRRLSGRQVCRGCGRNYHAEFQPSAKGGVCEACGAELYTRDDDREAAIARRLEVYREQTAPLITFYRGKGNLVTIDARPAPEAVAACFRRLFPPLE